MTDISVDTTINITDYPKLPVSVLEKWPETGAEAIHRIYEQEWQDFGRRVVVLDDDPTGVQTVHGISVYTDWTEESLREGMQEEQKEFFILTNSRSFTQEQTAAEHRLLAERALDSAVELGTDLCFVSRGDSTLRGHYPLELDVLREVYERRMGRKVDGQILCPYFQEGGRYTIDSVHYVREGEYLVPAGKTEFAKDKTFGFRSSHLGEYAQEKSGGKYRKEDGIYITLKLLRENRLDEITQLLMGARDFQLIVVDAIADSDVETFAVCLLRAMKAGKEYLIRSAAALPKVLGNISSRPLLTREELKGDISSAYGGIVLIGSHVQKTSLQLEALKQAGLEAEFLEFQVDACLNNGSYCESFASTVFDGHSARQLSSVVLPGKPGMGGYCEDGLRAETQRLISLSEQVMERGKTAVVYTSRRLLAPKHLGKEELLRLSVAVSDALTGVIAGLGRQPAFLIAKGGITSSDVGTKALKVKKALAAGQVRPGIPVWKTGPESKFPGLSYIIFPGNVGETNTLRDIVELLS